MPRDYMLLIAVGKLRPGPERMLFDRYAERLRPPLQVRELAEATGSVGEIKRREGVAMLAALPPSAFVVALDGLGQSMTSPALAAQLDRWRQQPHRLAFLIGGAEGLDAAVTTRADMLLALGPMTWPHMLARVLLTEQLYRAQTILAGHPYHRN